LDETAPKLTLAEKARAKRTVKNFELGASAFQRSELPACKVKNCESAFEHGKIITDTICTWIKKGFVSGPFSSPPVDNLRVNCLMAIDQKDKIRPVVNLSLPVKASFNENVRTEILEKCNMATAKQFGYRVFDCGKNAWMSKQDANDAYKIVPSELKSLRLQAFSWLDKIFIDEKQIFGANTAVANFDICGNTTRSLALAFSRIPRCLVLRCLDDFTSVCPSDKNWCSEFSANLKKVCTMIGITLAEDCPKADKAFTCKRRGKVLGSWFDTTTMKWFYPDEKIEKACNSIAMCLSKKSLCLNDIQKLMGSLNDFSQMMPFMSIFKRPLIQCLKKAHEIPNVQLSETARRDLLIWSACITDSANGLPLQKEPMPPPVSCKLLVSDAAGTPDTSKFVKDAGVGGIMFNEDGEIIHAFQKIWDKKFFEFQDSKGAIMGRKTTSLELMGLLLHIVSCPEKLLGQHLIFRVDNISCCFGLTNKYAKNDVIASILIRTILLVTSYLGSVVHPEHLPRLSTWEGRVVDRLSRLSTTSMSDRRLVDSFPVKKVPEYLDKWTKNPSEDWNMPFEILSYVKSVLEK